MIDETQPLRALTKAVKRRGQPGSRRAGLPGAGDLAASPSRKRGGGGTLMTPEAAEGRNVTTYVHSPFFGEFASPGYFPEQGAARFHVQVLPEGPITPGAIGAMRRAVVRAE
ncbi:opine metallophore biosynthesis dehydrogenase [Pseudomonas aeruginosa]